MTSRPSTSSIPYLGLYYIPAVNFSLQFRFTDAYNYYVAVDTGRREGIDLTPTLGADTGNYVRPYNVNRTNPVAITGSTDTFATQEFVFPTPTNYYNPNRFSTSTPMPAPRSAVDRFPIVEVEDDQECAICIDEIVKGEMATELPCCHYFHRNCIGNWLENKNTCPLCRNVVN